MKQDKIIIKGARVNNLKNIDLDIPRGKLVIMTGLSGSGKTSLAFDTIYAEGQRRYVESLSSYARQFLGGVDKPDVDSIEGLSPAIAIDQKTTSNNPRSTVGTVTEIFDFLRLLYARVGIAYCPEHNVPIKSQTIKQMCDLIEKYPNDSKLQILAPVIKNRKGSHKHLFEQLLKDGYIRVRVDGDIHLLENEINLDKNKRHNIEVVIDRIVKKSDFRTRLADSLEVACKISDGEAIVQNLTTEEDALFSQNHACNICGFSVPKLEPRLFSFNSPLGACPDCNGIGVKNLVDIDLLIPDKTLSINQGAIRYLKTAVGTDRIEWQKFLILCETYGIDLDKPLKEFKKRELNIILIGSNRSISYEITASSGTVSRANKPIEGVKTLIERRFQETTSSWSKDWYASFMAEHTCPTCQGRRLNPEVLSVKVGDLNISQLTDLSIANAVEFFNNLKLTPTQMSIAELVLKEIKDRLGFLHNVGLGYLNLSRKAGSLSGGEAQRIRLATQIGSRLTGVLYVLDEPSIGLHQRDNEKLIKTLKSIRDLGNSVLVVEHDEDTMNASDYIIDIGPSAGIHGGEVIAKGTPEEVKNNPNSITGLYLSGKNKIMVPTERRSGNGNFLVIKGAKENNLKNLDIKIPLGTMTIVTGVSGSGKSSLVNEVLYKGIAHNLYRSREKPGKHKEIIGLDLIDKVVNVSQDPIGRTPRSNPATYTGVFDDIRGLFANTKEAKIRGYDKGRFSFNIKGGRCEACQGDGLKKISMHFLPDVYVPCEECNAKRYNEETLQVTYKDKSIFDVLEMTVEDSLSFFENLPSIKHKMQTIYDVGLGYIKLGQSATTISGGEAQRVKLASELQKRATGKTLYILDEPTTGLHSHDVAKLIEALQRIVNNGDTVLIIEHNLDMIKVADYIIDLGPEGGDGGGEIIAKGTPEDVAATPGSYTGHFLKEVLNKNI
jgi:excinuclease ABC, A subunit